MHSLMIIFNTQLRGYIKGSRFDFNQNENKINKFFDSYINVFIYQFIY